MEAEGHSSRSNLTHWVVESSHQTQIVTATTSNKVAMIEGSGHLPPKPLTIHYNPAPQTQAPLVIQVPTPPAYQINRAIPWQYGGEVALAKKEEQDQAEEIINIARIGGKDHAKERKKEKVVDIQKEAVAKEKATKFLVLICHREYELLDQLNKTLTCVSLLSLLMNSKGHRHLLLKVLNKAQDAQDITLEKFGGIMNNITTNNHLSFSEGEILTEGKEHKQPLHIVVKCGNYMLARMLIDNGSSLNVLPKTTLDKLYSTGSQLRANFIVVQPFDGSKREVMEEITLLVCIGSITFDITFQVMDIQPT
ncbi:hypothetical protein CR513_56589, partial [Mucuna pruriens]